MKTELAKYHRETINGHTFRLRYIPGGLFDMGSGNTKDAIYKESPIHPVKLSAFYIGEFPVTQALWKVVMGKEHNPSDFKGDRRPVETVSWIDIVEGNQENNGQPAFLTRLNQLTQKTRPQNHFYRLPTEAEWEYAARGSKQVRMDAAHGDEKIQQDSGNYEYAGSDQLKEIGWYNLNSHSETKETGLKLPNEFGLYDMSGNVWEWCLDAQSGTFYQECLERGVVENPLCQDGHYRVIRGGSWGYSSQYCRVSYRNGRPPSLRAGNYGFRLVLSPQFSGNAKNSYGTE